MKCENEKSTNNIKEHIKQKNIKLMSLLREHKEKICELQNKNERVEKRILEIERKSR